uniref:Uncharacterized protein n=1 Tax=Colobus angolensis palliatus TaxID=336983 RepID=A0A2K5HYT9_COLAP
TANQQLVAWACDGSPDGLQSVWTTQALAEGVAGWHVTLRATGSCVQVIWRLTKKVEIQEQAGGLQSRWAAQGLCFLAPGSCRKVTARPRMQSRKGTVLSPCLGQVPMDILTCTLLIPSPRRKSCPSSYSTALTLKDQYLKECHCKTQGIFIEWRIQS